MKLELKHYAAYLPHKLKYFDITQLPSVFVLDTETLDGVINDSDHIGTIRFLLHPLSDLTKDEFSFIWDNETDLESIEQWIETPDFSNKFSFIFWQLLFENHFDLFRLIENSLAANINLLNE